ncbi:uncharacterized protein [Palaemon carinicauda]|uniref:uncharacterized protein n=1 Tax=Palaemon carinicauda TaxID=392227 RepID=UPI0035B58FDE
MYIWTCILWACLGAMPFAEAAHRNPQGRSRSNDVLTAPSGKLVEGLRQLLGVPSVDYLASSHHYAPPPRPPRYMFDLYRRISKEGSALPRHANTVRSFKPRTEDDEDMLLYNVSAVAREQVLGAWLHLRGSSGKSRLAPRLRPSRILVYLFPEVTGRYQRHPAPVMTHTLSPHQQEIELTRAVKEVVEDSENGRFNWGLMGLRVEEMKRGRYVPRSPEKMARRPPLLFVYSSDPTLLDLQALGAAALNLSKANQGHSLTRTTNLKRYIRGTEEGEDTTLITERNKRAIEFGSFDDEDIDEEDGDDEDDAEDIEGYAVEEEDEEEEEEEEEDEEEVRREIESSSTRRQRNRHHPLFTNELPVLPKAFPTERKAEGSETKAPTKRHRRRRRKNHRKRGKGEDDNLIPLPENYSKVKWGEAERRRKNKRRRRNRRLPDDWMAAAQNTLSNDANSVHFGAGLPGGVTPSRPCGKHKLEVNFKTLGWDHWIVAPVVFDAYYCAGVCPNPLTKQMSGSNHAIIQSMIYSMGLRPEVPAPCCVPEKLDGLTVLSMDSDERFILKTYSKMVVTSCSCQ